MKKLALFTLVLQLQYCITAEREPIDLSLRFSLILRIFNQNSTARSESTIIFNPNFSPYPMHYDSPQTIKLSSNTQGTYTVYTLDGSNPTVNSPTFPADGLPIYHLAGAPIKAQAINSEKNKRSDISEGTYTYSTLKTGQTTIFDLFDEGFYRPGVERGYQDNGDGTITDFYSGLIYQKCSAGQNNVTNCSGTATTSNWSNSLTYCNSLNLAGKTWRLPTQKELSDLVPFNLSFPAIHSAYFPSTQNSSYWTSTNVASNSLNAWSLNFMDGSLNNSFNKSTSLYTRCVTGSSIQTKSFKDNQDGTITDNSTNLIWQKCSAGQNNDTNCSGTATTSNWSNSLTYCNSLNLAGKNWKLPNINELKSIIDYEKSTSPSSFANFFPNTPAASFWTSSSNSSGTAAWFINLSNGSQNNTTKSNLFHLRCVIRL